MGRAVAARHSRSETTRTTRAIVTLDDRTWALHDAVFQVARECGLESFRVECKLGPEGETVISLVIARTTCSSVRAHVPHVRSTPK
jgi:hypothetical protein